MKIACIVAAAAALLAAPAFGADAGTYQRIDVPAPTLAGNLAGDPAVRKVSVYLPPGYEKNRKARYPVLYLLHGFTDSDANWFGFEGRKHFVRVPSAVDAAFLAGVPEFIVVMPDAHTKFQGSFYSNSIVNGDWETFMTRDLVAWVDGHYRTLAKPASRGLAGHSMGGYGTLRLAMKYPGIFSSIYAMSPCCLDIGMAAPPAEFLQNAAKVRSHDQIGGLDFMGKAMLAAAAAWSPAPDKPPLYVELPLAGEARTPEILMEWTANAPITMFHQSVPALRSYRAIGLDAGDKDEGIAQASARMHALLDSVGIAHDFQIYEGDHVNRIEGRLATKTLPFFGKHLAFK
jgi:enterochelin esterase-like enzyme